MRCGRDLISVSAVVVITPIIASKSIKHVVGGGGGTISDRRVNFPEVAPNCESSIQCVGSNLRYVCRPFISSLYLSSFILCIDCIIVLTQSPFRFTCDNHVCVLHLQS